MKPLFTDAVHATTTDHKKWADVGIPRDHWSYIEEEDHHFTAFTGKEKTKVTPTDQKNSFLSLVREIKTGHPLIIAYSEPTDFGALTFAYSILTTYQTAHLPVASIDLQYGSNQDLRIYPRVVVFHNVSISSTPQRIETLRDLVLRFRYAIRVVAIGGAPTNPVDWWRTTLRYRQTYTFVCKDQA